MAAAIVTDHAERRMEERLGHMTAAARQALADAALSGGKEWAELPPGPRREAVRSRTYGDDRRVVLWESGIFVFSKDPEPALLTVYPLPRLPSEKVVGLSHAWLVAHVLDPKCWNVPWTLFDYAGATLRASLVLIDLKARTFSLGLEARFPHKGDDDKSEGDVVERLSFQAPISHPEYTEGAFRRKLAGTYRQMTKSAAMADLRLAKDYALLRRDDDAKLADAKRQAQSLIAAAGVTDAILAKRIEGRYAERAKATAAEDWARDRSGGWYAMYAAAFAWWLGLPGAAAAYARAAGIDPDEEAKASWDAGKRLANVRGLGE